MRGKKPRCNQCLIPLEAENKIPLEMFVLVRDQNVMAGETPVALNLEVARREIARVVKDKEDQDVVLKRVIAAHANMLRIINEKRKEKLESIGK